MKSKTTLTIDKGLMKAAKVDAVRKEITLTELFERALKREIGIA